ncbi:MAG: hypothetical protein ABIH46_11480 [Chloroflexota bacterium]
MEIPAGKIGTAAIVLRNTSNGWMRGAYAEVDYGEGLVAASVPQDLAPGRETTVQVRLLNPRYAPLILTRATVRVRDATGTVYSEREEVL